MDIGTQMLEAAKRKDLAALQAAAQGRTSKIDTARQTNPNAYTGVRSNEQILIDAGYDPSMLTQSTQPISQAPPSYDPTNDINALKEAQRQKVMMDLMGKRNSQESNLTAEQAKIAPAYNGQRSTLATNKEIGAKNFAEYMASRGQVNSGVNDYANIARNVAYQGGLSGLYKQEQAANDDINRRRTDVNNAFATDVASANSGIEANAMEQLIAAKQAQAAQNFDNYWKNKTFDYQAGRDNVSDNRYNTEWNYQVGRDSVADQRYTDETNYKKQMDAYEIDFQRKQADIDNAFRNRQLSEQQKQNAIDNAFREKQYKQNVLEADRSYKLAQQKSTENTPKYDDKQNFTADDYAKYIESVYYQPEVINDEKTGRSIITAQGKRDIEKYLGQLLEKGVSPSIVDALAAKYNI